MQQLCSMKQKHAKYTQINTNKSMRSEMGPVLQGISLQVVEKLRHTVATALVIERLLCTPVLLIGPR